jgi:hypothetical protein
VGAEGVGGEADLVDEQVGVCSLVGYLIHISSVQSKTVSNQPSWDLPRQAGELAEPKARYDKSENRVIRDGKAVCSKCGQSWDRLVHGC